jgi:hypothetical protein
MFNRTIRVTTSDKSDKGKRNVPVVQFDDNGTATLPITDETDAFYLFSGKTAEDVQDGKRRIRATNVNVYFGKYEVADGDQVPVGFKVTLEAIYEEVKKPVTIPRKIARK